MNDDEYRKMKSLAESLFNENKHTEARVTFKLLFEHISKRLENESFSMPEQMVLIVEKNYLQSMIAKCG